MDEKYPSECPCCTEIAINENDCERNGAENICRYCSHPQSIHTKYDDWSSQSYVAQGEEEKEQKEQKESLEGLYCKNCNLYLRIETKPNPPKSHYDLHLCNECNDNLLLKIQQSREYTDKIISAFALISEQSSIETQKAILRHYDFHS